jgi:ATP-dependent RNA helicase DHR2
VRRVILSTNIAETSVTVPGVRYVVDGGKAKLRQFRSRLGLDTLLAKPVSQSSALQRAGRAGREAPGKCFRLYTAHAFAQLDAATVPEMLRCDLAQTMLLLKARGVHDVTRFPFLSAPPRDALEKALLLLHTLGALDDAGAVTPLGAQMARLPLAPTLSRVLLAAAAPARACLLEVIDIVACLSVDNVFVTVLAEELKAEADAARKRFVRREGDHLTLLATVQEYVAEAADRRAWARRHFVSHRAMRSVMVCLSFRFVTAAAAAAAGTCSSNSSTLQQQQHASPFLGF